jgi:hypothetical protein
MLSELGMTEVLPLDEETIKTKIEAGRIGNYALGRLGPKGTFLPKKIGRSEEDLQADLLHWAGYARYTHFAYLYVPTVKRAYEKECNNYHDLLPYLDKNPPHPTPPEGSGFKCPNRWCER